MNFTMQMILELFFLSDFKSSTLYPRVFGTGILMSFNLNKYLFVAFD